MGPWLQKMSLTYFWQQTRSKRPNCDETQTRHVVPPAKCEHTKFQIDISKHVEKKSDGRTDGRTLPRQNTSVIQTGELKLGQQQKKTRISREKLDYLFIGQIRTYGTTTIYITDAKAKNCINIEIPETWWFEVETSDDAKMKAMVTFWFISPVHTDTANYVIRGCGCREGS